MQAKVLLNTLAVALEQAKPKDFAAYLGMWRPGETLSYSLSDVPMTAATLTEAKA